MEDQQLVKTSNLLDLLNDEVWVKEDNATDTASEADWDGPIEMARLRLGWD
ncbi:MAG: hypothetical protein AAGH67_10100 [Cyanobacteria bacterium P01_H01_bin.162]